MCAYNVRTHAHTLSQLAHTCLSIVNTEQPIIIALGDLARRHLYRYHAQPDSAGLSEQIWWTRSWAKMK